MSKENYYISSTSYLHINIILIVKDSQLNQFNNNIHIYIIYTCNLINEI